MIYITGDTHGNIDFPKLKDYFSKHYATEEDYLLILGDGGLVWSEKECYIHDYAFLGPTVLYIDGNHENFELLDRFPVVTFHEARCHRLYRRVYHILRGEILHLNGLSFLCLGGASSHDKARRIDRVSWWEEENIGRKDYENALDNLEKEGGKVDYVLTHCGPSNIVKEMFGYRGDPNTNLLEELSEQVRFTHWYFGHYHQNKKWGKYRCFYGDILKIRKCNEGKKKVKYPLLVLRDDGYLYNYKTGRKTALKVEDLPEWYYCARHFYYSLQGVTDTAFRKSWTGNHLDKDAAVYLHYQGTLPKKDDYEPLDSNQWDAGVWRGYAKEVCLGLEKYSPHLDLRALKAAINLNYDRFNHEKDDYQEFVARPFPEVATPRYVDRYKKEEAHYVVIHGQTILSEFVEKNVAVHYAEDYITRVLRVPLLQRTAQNDKDDFLYAYDTGWNMGEWVFVKAIQ